MSILGMVSQTGHHIHHPPGALFHLMFWLLCLLIAGILILILGVGSRLTEGEPDSPGSSPGVYNGRDSGAPALHSRRREAA